MARPVAADAEATKARILNAACGLVSSHGIEGTSIRDIAKESSVSLATVLHYFGSKDSLYDACIDAMYTELDELKVNLMANFVPGSSPADALATVVRTSNRFAKEHRAAHRLLLRANLDEGGMRPDRRDRYMGQVSEEVAALLSATLGVSPARARLVHQTVAHLVVRYALQPPAELRLITGKRTDSECESVIEDLLVELAQRMLLDDAKRSA